LAGLTIIWSTALALAVMAVGWMSWLILARLVHQRRSVRRDAKRRAIGQDLIDIVRGAHDAKKLAAHLAYPRLVAEVLLEFVAVVRGDERERVIAALRQAGVDGALRNHLGCGSVVEQEACIDALAVFPGVLTERALRETVAESAPRLRLAALRALWASGCLVELQGVLDDWIAGKLNHSGLLNDFLHELIRAEPSAGVRAMQRAGLPSHILTTFIDALGEAGDYAAVGVLMEFAGAQDATVRTASLHALGRLRNPAVAGAVRAGLADAEWRVRLAACEAAGAIGLSGLAQPIAEQLQDPSGVVRFQAAAALAAMGPPGIEMLRQLAARSDEPAASAAILALAELAA